jgi:hypothetical protein
MIVVRFLSGFLTESLYVYFDHFTIEARRNNRYAQNDNLSISTHSDCLTGVDMIC